MIGLVIVTHGHLADELLHALEHVVGPQEAVRTIAVGPEDRMDDRRDELIEAVTTLDQGKGVIICTDMFGGTPSNLAIAVIDPGRVEVLTGVNLPMLVKLASMRKTESLAEAAASACEAARKYINVASSLLQDAKS